MTVCSYIEHKEKTRRDGISVILAERAGQDGQCQSTYENIGGEIFDGPVIPLGAKISNPRCEVPARRNPEQDVKEEEYLFCHEKPVHSFGA